MTGTSSGVRTARRHLRMVKAEPPRNIAAAVRRLADALLDPRCAGDAAAALEHLRLDLQADDAFLGLCDEARASRALHTGSSDISNSALVSLLRKGRKSPHGWAPAAPSFAASARCPAWNSLFRPPFALTPRPPRRSRRRHGRAGRHLARGESEVGGARCRISATLGSAVSARAALRRRSRHAGHAVRGDRHLCRQPYRGGRPRWCHRRRECRLDRLRDQAWRHSRVAGHRHELPRRVPERVRGWQRRGSRGD